MIERIADMLYVERNVLSQEQCDELIKYFWENEKNLHQVSRIGILM